MTNQLQDLQGHLEDIVNRRKKRLPWFDERAARLAEVKSALVKLRREAGRLPADWSSDAGVRDALARLNDNEAFAAISNAELELESLKKRFARDTVNVGVCGRARVGKSKMLQSVSGLGENQVPTGDGPNVTAVRSRIFHASRERAVIRFHTRAQFFAEIVQPYFSDLNLFSDPNSVPAPASLDQFCDVSLDPSRFEGSQEKSRLIDRLIAMQRAIPGLTLDGGEKVLDDLSDLRRYVAYEQTTDLDTEEKGGPAAPRDYLAVRDCSIDAPFPVTPVNRLGLIDLPGLGEVASGLDKRIVAGIRGEVDAVLFVFRAAVGLTNIDEIDIRAVDLIREAQGAIKDSRDFVCVVVNAGEDEASRADDLRSQIQRTLNRQDPDSRYFVVTADARSPESVHEKVLRPVLERLAQRLDVMDQALIDGVVTAMSQALQPAEAAATHLKEAITRLRGKSGPEHEELNDLAHKFLIDLQRSLEAVQPESLKEDFIVSYEQQLEGVHRSVKAWLTEGLGIGDADLGPTENTKEAWVALADGERGVRQSHGPFANRELHRLRVAVSRRYAALDDFVNDVLIERFYSMVCDALVGIDQSNTAGANRAALLSADEPTAAGRLASLLHRLEQCPPEAPVPGLAAAFRGLVGIRFDFRLQSLPLLLELNEEVKPADQTTDRSAYPPAFVADSTEFMYDWFFEEFVQYSYGVMTALREDAERQFKVLRGAAAVLEDEVSRSGTSEKEVRRFIEAYRDELWPDRFDDLNGQSARARQVLLAADALRTALDRTRENAA